MIFVRHIALLVAMTFATLVVGFVPSPADAHDGHARLAPMASASEPPPARIAAKDVGRAISVEPLRWDVAHAHGALPCSDPCCPHCGPACHGCCAMGLLPSLAPVAFPHCRAASTSPRDWLIPPEIAPETLPEPPKSLA